MKVIIGFCHRFENKRNYVQYEEQQRAYDHSVERLCRSAA